MFFDSFAAENVTLLHSTSATGGKNTSEVPVMSLINFCITASRHYVWNLTGNIFESYWWEVASHAAVYFSILFMIFYFPSWWSYLLSGVNVVTWGKNKVISVCRYLYYMTGNVIMSKYAVVSTPPVVWALWRGSKNRVRQTLWRRSWCKNLPSHF